MGITSKNVEFLAKSWLLPQEDATLVLGGDGRIAGGHRPEVGREMHALPTAAWGRQVPPER